RAADARPGAASRRARVPSRGGRGLLRAQGGGARSRAPGGRAARPARLGNHPGQHAHDDRARDGVREAGVRAGGGRLMAGLRGRALVAYLLVCVVWGSTYLAIRVGVATLPPFLFAGVRFLLAGAALLALGNAFVVWAEQYTPSGIASIFVVTVALWMAFFDAVLPGGGGELDWRVL